MMFRKTRNRIMLLNMVMVSATVIVAFAVVFITAYTREMATNREKLENNIIPQVSIAGGPFRIDAPFHVVAEGVEVSGSGFARRIIPNAGVSFSLLVDSAGNLVEVNSVVEMPEAVYEQAALQTSGKDGRDRVVSLDGRTWQYTVSPVTVEFKESANVAFFVSGEYRDVRFLDVTDSHNMLWSLGLTLSGLTIVILAAFYFISRLFANRAIRPMEDAFDRQNRFIADASHELKTPLSVISANCGVLYANGDETLDSQSRWVDSIMRAADRMTSLVNDLLSLACMEDRENELRTGLFDLGRAADEAMSEAEQTATEKGLGVRRFIEPGMEVNSDRASVLRILSVLLDNAIKYTEAGGEISVSVKKEKQHIGCYVRNSGEGVPKEELPRLFDRFYRGDPSRSSENGGSGLGLSIAGAIAERLGARLVADSVLGEYTEFCLLFDIR